MALPKEHYLTARNGDLLYLTPITGVVTNQFGEVCNGDVVTFQHDGRQTSRTIPIADRLQRHVLRGLAPTPRLGQR